MYKTKSEKATIGQNPWTHPGIFDRYACEGVEAEMQRKMGPIWPRSFKRS